ncbi:MULTISPECIES: hypothetical protein [Clostridium]|uniref:Uncharacterized protein n=1 Tax=Clostridium faecium TaxID=2762223 RepID=A0ABR8YRY4_9CLOT|nr:MULTISPECIES: hypothetical protein [Clostridium]MBD8046778.1 hypothetical protein [Clostridium faecium]
MSNYKCEYFVIGTDENSIFKKGDEVSVSKEGEFRFIGVITLVTCKGIYLNVGNRKDKYFRIDNIDKIERVDLGD